MGLSTYTDIKFAKFFVNGVFTPFPGLIRIRHETETYIDISDKYGIYPKYAVRPLPPPRFYLDCEIFEENFDYLIEMRKYFASIFESNEKLMMAIGFDDCDVLVFAFVYSMPMFFNVPTYPSRVVGMKPDHPWIAQKSVGCEFGFLISSVNRLK